MTRCLKSTHKKILFEGEGGYFGFERSQDKDGNRNVLSFVSGFTVTLRADQWRKVGAWIEKTAEWLEEA